MRSIDVIIPCYNYARFLQACVDSVVTQEGVDVRVLIIDDASSDETAYLARHLAESNPKVSFIHHNQNCGHIATYNQGISWASRDYMLILSADDYLSKGSLNRAISLLEDSPSVGFVYGQAIRFSDPAVPLTNEAGRSDGPEYMGGLAFIEMLCLNPVNPVDTATAVVRTSIQRKVGGYNPALPHSGDLEMWLRLSSCSDVCRIGQVQAFTRIHSDNMRHSYNENMFIGDYRQKLDAFRHFFTYSVDDTEIQRFSRVVYRKIAEDAVWKASIAFESGVDANVVPLLNFAKSAYPRIYTTSVWWKLMLKRRLGLRRCGEAASTIASG